MIKCGAKIMTISFEKSYRNYLPTKEQNKELVEIKLILKTAWFSFRRKVFFLHELERNQLKKVFV